MANKDGALLEVITGEFIPFIKQYEKEPNDEAMIEHPLDEDVFNILKTINIKENDNEYAIFEYSKEINSLWKLIIEKSIKCLRYFDERDLSGIIKTKASRIWRF